MKPLPNLLFVKTIAEIEEDARTRIRLARFINGERRYQVREMSWQREDALTIGRLNTWIYQNITPCSLCGRETPGTTLCGLCSSALVGSQINSENLPTAR